MKKLLLLVSALVSAALSAHAQTYTVTPSSTTYSSAGGNLSFTVALAYPAGASAVGFSAKPPGANWKYISGTAPTSGGPEVQPDSNDVTDPAVATSTFDFSYQTPPANSASFTFTLKVPDGLSGNQVLTFSGHYRVGGVRTDVTVASVTLTQATEAPQITTQPVGQSVLAGSSASFTVVASGSPTLAYQWYFTPASSSTPQAISGATSPTYTITNVQSANVGDYNVVVSNGVSPNATSSAAQLSIAARILKVASVTGAPGSNIVVPIQLIGAGNENALGFSIAFDSTQLTYVSAAVGANSTDASLNPNTSAAASGRVGIAIAKPTNVVWSAGTQEVVKLTFTIGATVANNTSVAVTFGDSPVGREVSDALANALPAAYQGGAVTALSGFEADMNGNGTVSITDWVKVGRIVAGLDPVPTGVDFLKADCSPRSTLGNGVLSITDWVQAGRYAAGLDPLTVVGGPAPSSP